MRVRERREVRVRARERGERVHAAHEPCAGQLESLAVQDQVGVVRHVGAGRAQVDDPFGGGRVLAEEVHVRHDVVTETLLQRGCPLEVERVELRAHLGERFLRDVEAELRLGFGEREPETAPDAEPTSRGEDRLHLPRRVAVRERVHVAIEGAHGGFSVSSRKCARCSCRCARTSERTARRDDRGCRRTPPRSGSACG